MHCIYLICLIYLRNLMWALLYNPPTATSLGVLGGSSLEWYCRTIRQAVSAE
jgi:hypothetical protein